MSKSCTKVVLTNQYKHSSIECNKPILTTELTTTQETTTPEPKPDNIIIIGGSLQNGQPDPMVEIVDLELEQSCHQDIEFAHELSGAVSGFVNGIPTICTGHLVSAGISKDCYQYNMDTFSFNKSDLRLCTMAKWDR